MKLKRREFLAGAAAMAVTPAFAALPSPKTFPKDFLWGASTSAYQIEGALDVDGRGPDIWDTYTKQGRITDGTSAARACEHYTRYPEDVALMKAAHFNAYRFSIAWPRIVPAGTGAINAKGLDFYDRLVDEILKAGIKPMACLYHWDLPQPLQDKGGWQGREVVGPFADYARIITKRLGDRVKDWMMLNEPNVVSIFGYGLTDQAPGLNLGEMGVLKALHHQNLAQGAALRAIRAEHADLRLGTVTNIQPCRPDTDSDADRAAAIRWDAVWNRVTVDGLLRGQIPDVLAEKMAPIVQAGDLDNIKFPIDLLGINYYSRCTMKYDPDHMFQVWWGDPKADRYTFMGWPVQPDGLYDLLMEFKNLYGNPATFVAENGAAYDDVVSPDGQVHDVERTQFLQEHIAQVGRALGDGANIKGYLAWSLLDNFEWSFGLSKRFGIIRVDYDTQKRTPKDSYKWYADFIKQARGL
ncbi:Beta-glucosidase A [Magnetospirillum gryphiswaldense MSR-1]|uniref:Beta-glucosidase n=3 Tax=Magnetospirillum gryphiswaldense TaxID=55518 RepID=V6F7V4_MAGGM|nr:Beta-glucosidase A [Magnetospirillum gryphiswaldense MSR-1]AVM79261.1 Beta-glucosidase A [Magnetospirillum gryphiswaldense]CAM76400.1 Beta-glucosidase A [Magnetospirillum gryphiswaldense MSR-1]CDL00376.1 aryl-phospho-beta-d-glucosidase [Magnetospirillum gryphiswaldense MSR-1 v2]